MFQRREIVTRFLSQARRFRDGNAVSAPARLRASSEKGPLFGREKLRSPSGAPSLGVWGHTFNRQNTSEQIKRFQVDLRLGVGPHS